MKLPPCARLALGLMLGVILALGSGCGGKEEVPVFPVQGRVTLDKVPFTSGIVGLHADPERGNAYKGVFPWGRPDAKGNYMVQTQGRDGAPLGAYKVTITPDVDGPQPNRKYAKVETTDLSLEVSEAPEPGAFDLRLQR